MHGGSGCTPVLMRTTLQTGWAFSPMMTHHSAWHPILLTAFLQSQNTFTLLDIYTILLTAFLQSQNTYIYTPLTFFVECFSCSIQCNSKKVFATANMIPLINSYFLEVTEPAVLTWLMTVSLFFDWHTYHYISFSVFQYSISSVD